MSPGKAKILTENIYSTQLKNTNTLGEHIWPGAF